ncbi:hypothetical protein GPALN_016282 [Globodera pallida]|nr:hypothetical protein GPALN_016282 [Globodera pallida]
MAILNFNPLFRYSYLFCFLISKEYRSTPLWDFFENVRPNGVHYNSVILGDSAFPIRRWLLTPYSTPQGIAQERFNYLQSKGRVKIEHAFGVWKRRFSINKTGFRVKLSAIPKCIIATVVLHNIALDWNMPLPEEEENEEFRTADEDAELEIVDEPNTGQINERTARINGQNTRDAIAQRLLIRRD